jgi:phospholipase A1/A2
VWGALAVAVVLLPAPTFAQSATSAPPSQAESGQSAASAKETPEQCLLREIALAAPETTVLELRRRCLELAARPAPQPGSTILAQGADATSLRPKTRLAQLLDKPETERSPLERRLVSELVAWDEPFALLPHRQNYLLPVSYIRRSPGGVALPPELLGRKSIETTFQTSLKFPASPPLFGGRGVVFLAYTGRAWWQVYDGQISRPFREYNHEPEVFLALPGVGGEFLGWQHRLSTVGLNHQSNGRTQPYSRSWNRLMVEGTFDRGNTLWASARLWYRIPEKRKASPMAADGDDNPDITRLAGRGDLRIGYLLGNQRITLGLRHALTRGGKGAAQLDYSRPSGFSPALRWYVQASDGYGDSLIDYDRRIRRVSLGIMLNDWF